MALSLASLPTELRIGIFSSLTPAFLDLQCQCVLDSELVYPPKNIRYKTGGLFVDFIPYIRDRRPRVCYPPVQNPFLPYLTINKQITGELLDPRAQLKPQVAITFCERRCMHTWLRRTPGARKRSIDKIKYKYIITTNDAREMKNAFLSSPSWTSNETFAAELSRIDLRELEQHFGKIKINKYQVTQQSIPHYWHCNLDAEIEVDDPKRSP